ncbi:tetratricopeptide repeat protein [Rubrivivax sp. RP6-9]|uniref:tetratricopeptide repeat protein n=1 Tax=Rubrivivax sp. RP6-9 TaxID=3415750 RepID=UPI003CC584AF
MTVKPRWRHAFGAVMLAICSAWPVAHAQAPGPAADAPAAPPVNSALDAPLLYQLLIGEIELRTGEPGAAYEVILDAARRSKDEALFRRAVDIALQGRAGEQALAATRAWRTAHPKSLDPLRLQLQILSALNRLPDAVEPLRTLLNLTPAADRPGLIAALPRFFGRGSDPAKTAALLEDVLAVYARDPATRVPALVSVGRGRLAAGESDKALAAAQQAQREDGAAPGPVLLALELLPKEPEAEAIVTTHMARADAEPSLRLAWVRTLTQQQRYADAVRELEVVTRQKPDLAPPFLSLGALHLELRHPKEGEAALLRYVELAQAQRAEAAAPAASAASAAEADDDDTRPPRPEQGLIQAWLMLAQAAEQRSDFPAAEAWLAKIDDPQRALEVQTRRASMLARQGRIDEARAVVRATPERDADDARSKLLAEAGVLRDVKRWKEALEVLSSANERFPDDTDLLYEQAMMAEKLNRMDELERLLRRVIELKPDSAQAYNALGYSLADRRVRLVEARELIRKALELTPGDPFITDSLGWVEYRLGNRDEALRLLRQAYAARPDPEIAAHLGEVLWSFGQQDEARKVWIEARGRDAANDVLRETLARLKVAL